MSVDSLLADYAAGRVTAQELVGMVARAYYGDGGRGTRDGLKPIMDLVERAHPGVVELSSTENGPGFSMRLAERPFPKRYEAELRQVVTEVLGGTAVTRPSSPVPRPNLFTRVFRAIRRVFSASA